MANQSMPSGQSRHRSAAGGKRLLIIGYEQPPAGCSSNTSSSMDDAFHLSMHQGWSQNRDVKKLDENKFICVSGLNVTYVKSCF